ncbi:MAG: DsbA family protein [Chitinophagaceae bacterium]
MATKNKSVPEVISPKSFFMGATNAPVTIIMFGDYESEACYNLHGIIKRLLSEHEGKIRFSYRHFPLTQVHQRAQKAAEASVAALQENMFWSMHDMLFTHRKQLGIISMKGYAKEIGFDKKACKRFLDALVNATFSWEVRADLLDGLALGIREVPALLINGERYRGNFDYESIQKSLDAIIKQSKHQGKAVRKRA